MSTSLSSSVGKKGQSRAERTRTQILVVAGLRFAELGYAGTRLEDVGRDVGIGRSAVLYHFKDKRLLYRAVLDDLFGDLIDVLHVELMVGGSLVDRLEDAICRFVDFMGRDPTAARLAMRELIALDPEIREEFQAMAKPHLESLEAILAAGARSGEFHPLRSDPYHFLSTIAGSTLFYVAALPTLIEALPYDRLAPDQLDAHKRDLIAMTRRFLGIDVPRSRDTPVPEPTTGEEDV